MTATLTFNLNNPDDIYEHKIMLNATKFKSVLFEINQYLDKKILSSQITDNSEKAEACIEIKQFLLKECQETGVDINE